MFKWISKWNDDLIGLMTSKFVCVKGVGWLYGLDE
jgi:hypothetical protein